MPKTEVSVTCNDGTKFKIYYDKKHMEYVLSYRNDRKALPAGNGQKIKGKWLCLDRQPFYSDALDFMCDEIKQIDAKEGAG
jgi:hypothetical protein